MARGSLPVALTARDVREKILGALRAARGRPLASETDLESIVAGLPFAAAGTYGGHSSCVQIDTGGPEFFVCDMGSGLRPFGQATTAQRKGMAQTFHINTIPHASISVGIFMAASLVTSSALQRVPYHEYQHSVFDRNLGFTTGDMGCADGHYTVPTGPGLGVEPKDSLFDYVVSEGRR